MLDTQLTVEMMSGVLIATCCTSAGSA